MSLEKSPDNTEITELLFIRVLDAENRQIGWGELDLNAPIAPGTFLSEETKQELRSGELSFRFPKMLVLEVVGGSITNPVVLSEFLGGGNFAISLLPEISRNDEKEQK